MKKSFTKLLGALLCALFFVPNVASATITATWDWQNNIPSATIRTVNIQGASNTGYVASNVAEISFYVDATVASGKLAYVSDNGYAQFNAGTKIQVPVVSTSDKITIKTFSNQHNYTFGGTAATSDEQTFDVTEDQVSAGYAEIVSTAYMNIYSIVAVLAHKPYEIAAKWTFDTGYDISGKICTPNSEAWAAVPSSNVQAKNNDIYKYVANTRYQSSGNYYATIGNDETGSTYYYVMDNNGYGKVLYLYPYGGTTNNITDYTDKSQHVLYYELSFPTIGLKDIKASVDFTFYNDGTKKMEFVYSTDGGSTWIDAGSMYGTSNWYTYNTTTVSISAENKENVIVRLLPENLCNLRVYLNSFTVVGTHATTSVTISDAKYATYYNSIPVQLPANLQAATVDNETSGTLAFNYRYAEGDVIPGGTPVLLKATAAGDYTLTYAANNTDAAPAGNYLYGSDVAVTTTGGGTGAKYYSLQNGSNGLGFYWGAAEGAAFESGAHKAWLALPAASTARFFSLEGNATGIRTLEPTLSKGENVYYNLQGQRVLNPTKGLYIVNGKKVIIK